MSDTGRNGSDALRNFVWVKTDKAHAIEINTDGSRTVVAMCGHPARDAEDAPPGTRRCPACADFVNFYAT